MSPASLGSTEGPGNTATGEDKVKAAGVTAGAARPAACSWSLLLSLLQLLEENGQPIVGLPGAALHP